MDYYVFSAFNSLKCLFYKMRPRLHEHLHRNVVGDQVPLYKCTHDFIFCFGSRREAYFNFFKSNVNKSLKVKQLFLKVHGVDKRLVAVAHIYAAPYGRFCNYFVRPRALFKSYWFKWDVLFAACVHDKNSSFTYFVQVKR